MESLLIHLRKPNVTQKTSKRKYLYDTYGQSIVDKAHELRYITFALKGDYAIITLKGREVISGYTGNLYTDCHRILSEAMRLK